MEIKVYTSINIPVEMKEKLEQCAHKLDIDMSLILSVLCYKAGRFVCKEASSFQTVDYQERGEDYEIMPVWFLAADHEYMHGCRLSCKVSVSKLLACAMYMFLDDIMENGINQMEIAQIQNMQNSYNKKTFLIRNFDLKIVKNDQFQEYIMKMRMTKT